MGAQSQQQRPGEIAAGYEWFAIQTKSGGEEIAAQTLATLDLETLLPRARLAGLRPRRTARRERPLFPGYCFARFHPGLHLHAVRYSRGVWRVVGTDETPWPVEERIIADLRLRLDVSGCVDLEPRRWLRGDPVRICEGPFAGWTGVFDSELSDRMRVVILLQAIEQARVVMRRDWAELAEAT